MYEHVCSKFLSDCELDELLHEPPSNRSAASLHPKVRAQCRFVADRVGAATLAARPPSLRVSFCCSQRPEQRKISTIDDDPVVDCRREDLQASTEQRAAVPIRLVADGDECDRCGHVLLTFPSIRAAPSRFEGRFLTESTESRARKYRIARLPFQADLRGTTVEPSGKLESARGVRPCAMDGRLQ